MSKREMLKKRIEEERRKLDEMLEQEKSADEIYEQSVTLDRLIEEYLV
ncbi:MAG: Spo0E family sporulation regulatory protein-aspartic acid phosphatase [Eubacteriales bacterium]|nr:Spo0E family sporulation regulatory protein-aspartic acid phosphatase [Eubacteriales bacterium]